MRKLIAVLAATSTVVLGGCDPFNEEPGGTPTVISAFASIGFVPVDGTTPTAGGVVTIDNIPSLCDAGTVTTDVAVFWVKFNKLLDGASIQTAPDDCTPVATALSTATPVPAGGTWYACYNPSSPTPAEGASIAIFWAPTPTPGVKIGGWIAADVIPAGNTDVTTYHFAGSVRDKGGTAAAFDVTANVDPNPGAPGDPTFGTTTATSVVVNWAAAACADAATTQYVVQRAPDVAGAAGTFADVATVAAGTLTYTDTGLTTATTYWYRVQSRTATGVLGDASGEASVTTL